jgi:hypothetical protein
MHSILERVRETLTESRFIANLTVTYGIIVVMVIISLIVRRLLGHGGERLAQWTGLRWLDSFGREAAQRSRRLVARLTWLGVVVLTGGGIAYHMYGRDIRADARAWYADISADWWLRVGLRATGVAALVVAAWVGIRMVRRLCALAEPWVAARVGPSVTPGWPTTSSASWFTCWASSWERAC